MEPERGDAGRGNAPREQGRTPAELRRFVQLFNREEFWESHEVLEDPWRELGSDFYQGLILYASAFVHAQRGNRHGIIAQLAKAEERLAPYRPAYLGVDVEGIFEHAKRCRQIVRANSDAARTAWETLIPFPQLALSNDRVRGDEPELGAAPA